LSEIGLGGLNKILSGIAETTSLVADMSRASEGQLITSRQVTEAISSPTPIAPGRDRDGPEQSLGHLPAGDQLLFGCATHVGYE